MTESSKDVIKIISESIIFLMILAVLFAPEGIIMGTYDYVQYAEPVTLQSALARAIETATYSPDYFYIEIESSGKAHMLMTEKDYENNLYYIQVMPSQKSEAKTHYIEADPFVLPAKCTIQEVELSLGEVNKIYIIKELTDTGCEITISAGQPVEETVPGIPIGEIEEDI